MVNEKRMEFLHNSLLAELAKKINSRKAEDKKINPSDEEVFGNITDIYDEIPEMEFGQPTEKVTKYMPKAYKEMVMRLISPTYAFSYRTAMGDYAVTVEAFLLLDYTDTQPAAIGKATIPYSAAPESEVEEYQRKAYCEAMARGLAESKAYQKYGIGCWFNQNVEPDDDPEKAVQKAKTEEGMNPEIALPTAPEEDISKSADGTETSEQVPDKGPKSDKEDKKKAAEEKKSEAVKDPVLEKPKEEQPTSGGEMSMSLDEALNLPCEIGKAASQGLTLGETAEKYPANLVWQYVQTNISNEAKTAIKVIATAKPEIAQLFADRNVTL